MQVPETNTAFMIDRRRVLALVLGTVVTPSCATPLSPEDPSVARLNLELDTAASCYGTVGHSVAVLRRGRLVHARHAGLANREAGTPVSAASRYPIFSISKLFLIVEMLKARYRGAIDLAMPLQEIRSGLPRSWREISLAQILAHVSGLPNYVPDHVAPSANGAFAAIRELPLRFAPGTANDYNQTNFLLAREALEAATGHSLVGLVQRQFDEAGMRSAGYASGYPDGRIEVPGLVASYRPTGDGTQPPARFAPPSFAWPAYTFGSTGVVTTLDDMVRWTTALLSGSLLPLGALRASWAPFPLDGGAPARHSHGWNWERHGDITIVGHGGDNRLVWRHFFRTDDPADSATVIYFDNGGRVTFDNHRFAALLADVVMPGAAPPFAEEEETLFRALAGGVWPEAAARFRDRVPGPEAEATVNRVGYDALFMLSPQTALLPFGWNVRAFPRSANAHDSLGEAYRAAGDVRASLQSYERARALDPGNARIQATVEELRALSATEDAGRLRAIRHT